MADDPRWAGSRPRLVEAIRDEILAAPRQRITFARFMRLALTEPDAGYYATSDLRPTRAGDFLTAPELHPFFGRCIGRFVTGVRAARDGSAAEAVPSDRAGPFRVREFGAGRGTLREAARPELTADVEWTLVDLPSRSEPAAGPADLVLANEFLDALPVHRLVQARGLLEAWVGWVDGWFAEILAEPSTPELQRHLALDGVSLLPGQRAEVCLDAPRWMAEAATALAPGGVLLVIDYGHPAAELYGPRRMAGTLLTYRAHEVGEEPFTAVGSSDITTHVDLTALERAASAAGLVLVGSTTQGRFLARLGLGDLLAEAGRSPDADPQAYLEARAAVVRLLDPRHLGGFRVLAWARPAQDGSVPELPAVAAAP